MEAVVTQPSGYAALVGDSAPALLRLAVMLAGSREDGEDLLQSSLLRAARHGERIAAMDAPTAYLRTVIVHEHASRGRRRSRRVREVGAVDMPDPAVASRDEAVVLRDQIWRWLATLSAQQRAVLVLRYYEDIADAEIASILGCPESTVRSHARRGLTALRAHLADQPEADR
jgi:RNA polymerase sigma-70 factor (sigma-E family)